MPPPLTPTEEEQQRAVIEFLSDPSSFGGAAVERIDTHISRIFLAGNRAYKLKRAVRLDFVDFSAPEKRRAACEAEIQLNRRTAPELYLRTVPITREAGRLMLGGGGEALDWVVEMKRFERGALLSERADEGRLDLAWADALADAVAAFHSTADRPSGRGGAAAVATVIDGLDSALASGAGSFDGGRAARALTLARRHLEAHGDLLDQRRRQGFVRRCHGDLHLGNICLLDGRPVPFDCIEFSDELASIDTLYDLSFLLMDLWRRGERDFANRLFNRYQESRPDGPGLAALPLFMGMRALVRAKVNVLLADAAEAESGASTRAEALSYLDTALELLSPVSPRLLAIGGLSGSGKTTVARRLASGLPPPPGALILRSDVVRKELAGVATERRLGAEDYRPAMSAEVYAALRQRAAVALSAGHSVIADAVHAQPAERDALEALAREIGVAFSGVWLEAPPRTLEGRVASRRGDASDATVAVVRQQLDYDLGVIGWARVEASGPPAAVADETRRRLGLAGESANPQPKSD